MTDANKPMRDALLEAAITLAQQRGSALQLTMAEIAAEASESLQQAQQCYPDMALFHRELLQYLLDLARANAIETMPTARPGLARIRTAFQAYLDINLRHRALRELALHFRNDPDGAERLRLRARGVKMLTQMELHAAGWPNSAPAARLLTAMVLDVAVAEFEAGGALPSLREAMFAYLKLPAGGVKAAVT